ncbi:uncharacterized protein C8Q71DRAFT_740088 [Rhodofomes roseus]|uniref:Uncharacterized protein n=1 Tax=Rhodofomes roseus TaxID=34475 RepID=A0ABQ8KPP3_9APHY|nr:uncharacterized protein C8Q71DRAFT_740088 [Rhodofomes roseus]KAH9840574.1 hypothetical protein C8Q71DRAFT_740088 [Rhodofomes roseus]
MSGASPIGSITHTGGDPQPYRDIRTIRRHLSFVLLLLELLTSHSFVHAAQYTAHSWATRCTGVWTEAQSS